MNCIQIVGSGGCPIPLYARGHAACCSCQGPPHVKVAPPEAGCCTGWSEPSAGNLTTEPTNATSEQHAQWRDVHIASQHASPRKQHAQQGLHLAFPTPSPMPDSQQQRPDDFGPWNVSAHGQQSPAQPAAHQASGAAAAISPTIQIGAIQISLSDGTISFDGGATKLALAALPQAAAGLAPASASALPAQAQPVQLPLHEPSRPAEADAMHESAVSKLTPQPATANMDRGGSQAILSGLVQPAEKAVVPAKPMQAMQSPFCSRDQQPTAQARPTAALTPARSSHTSEGRMQSADSIPILSGLSPSKKAARACQPASAKTIPPSRQHTSEDGQPACEEPSSAQAVTGAAKQEGHASSDDTAHLPPVPAQPTSEHDSHQHQSDKHPGEAEDSHAATEEARDPTAAYQHAQGYDVFAGQRAPDSPVRTASTNLLAADGSNYFLGSDHGPLVLNLDAMATSHPAKEQGGAELSNRAGGAIAFPA